MKKTQRILLKCKFLISVIVLILAVPNLVKAQNTPVIHQNWKMIGESATHYEVSARVIQCHPDSAVQLHVELFNEGGGAQTAHFNLSINNPANNEQMVREISYAMASGDLIIPLCENNDYQPLRISLPANWDPAAVTFTLTIIQ